MIASFQVAEQSACRRGRGGRRRCRATVESLRRGVRRAADRRRDPASSGSTIRDRARCPRSRRRAPSRTRRSRARPPRRIAGGGDGGRQRPYRWRGTDAPCMTARCPRQRPLGRRARSAPRRGVPRRSWAARKATPLRREPSRRGCGRSTASSNASAARDLRPEAAGPRAWDGGHAAATGGRASNAPAARCSTCPHRCAAQRQRVHDAGSASRRHARPSSAAGKSEGAARESRCPPARWRAAAQHGDTACGVAFGTCSTTAATRCSVTNGAKRAR